MADNRIRGVHLPGSVCLPSAEDVFRKTAELLPGRLRRVPDGETQHRHMFTMFQRAVFQGAPQVLRQYDESFNTIPADPVTPEEVERVVKSLGELHTGYDTYAIESYQLFCTLREQGVIAPGIRFQVSLPSTFNVMCVIAEPYQAALEPVYEAALLKDLKNIEKNIPAEDLAIQWDLAGEIAAIEGAYWPHMKPYFSPVREHINQMHWRLGNAVSPNIQMGFHLCYGDMGGRPFCEPKDSGLLVDIAIGLFDNVHRPINWIHMPVPKNRDDEAYFAPLKKLEKRLEANNTEFYLGVVHAEDEEGTRRRIQTALGVVKSFGVGTVCGMGRTSPEKFSSIMSILAAVSSPVLPASNGTVQSWG